VVKMGLSITDSLEENNLEAVHTERLFIRRFAETDLADVLAYQTHPETFRYLASEPMSEEKAAAFLARQANPDTWTGAGWLALAVVHPGDAKVIGEVGVFVEAKPKSDGNIGWMLHPEYHGQGYATEAARVLLAHAFEERGLHRLTSGCDARNTASWRLMERLGMRREAHSRQSHLAGGVWQDEYLYALLRDEWLNQKTNAPLAGRFPG